MKWFKFYGQDWMTDLKVMRMSVEDRLCFITLLCLASASNEKGVVKDCSEEALIQLTHLYEDPYNDDNEVARARGCLKRFVDNKMITDDNAGAFHICNFAKRQGQNLTSYERVKRYRDKQSRAKNITKTTNKKVINDNIDDNANDNARIEENRIEENNTLGQAQYVSEIIKAFEEVDPKNKTFYGNTTQRRACDFLLQEYGLDRVLQVIKVLPQINQKKLYVGQITTHFELKEKWVKVANALKQEKDNKKIIL